VCLIVGDCSQAKTHTIWRQISGTLSLQELSGSSSGRDAIRYAEELLTGGSLHGEWAHRNGWSTKTIGTLHGARRRRRRRGDVCRRRRVRRRRRRQQRQRRLSSDNARVSANNDAKT